MVDEKIDSDASIEKVSSTTSGDNVPVLANDKAETDRKRDPSDKRGRIKGMGVFEIILGSLCGLLSLFVLLVYLFQHAMVSKMGAAGQNPVGSLIFSLGVYIVLTVSLFWVGIGAVKLRRWVPKVVLAVNWPLLIMGVAATVGSIWFLPIILKTATASAGVDAGLSGRQAGGVAMITTVVTVVTMVTLLLSYVMIPGLHVLMFSGKKVQATCDRYDPKPRWTDDLPGSLVGLVLWLVIIAFSWLGMGIAGFGAIFGLVLTGTPALVLGIVAAVSSGILSYLVVRRHPFAWWGCLLFLLVIFGGSLSTFLLLDLGEFYRRTGMFAEQQLTVMAPMLGVMNRFMRLFIGGFMAAAIVFLLFVKKHFKARAA